MTRRAAPRRRRAAARPGGSELHRLLSLPARRNLRWPVIAGLVLASGGLYAQVLLTAAPMPPSQAPLPAAGSGTGTADGTAAGTTSGAADSAAGTTSGTANSAAGTTDGTVDGATTGAGQP
ncbi:hypothetical protein [Kitasatospora sp. LaBMicrA B282]|uniref:hypothetical protein n=1 Tax=Kitasatospora sp. LaBMicrA B282 TaxID=3420949 RepID=UPI003D0A8CCA